MKYIFMAGAPGSKWSSVAKNIYYSPSIDRSDNNQSRIYANSVAYNGAPMHIGSYFDPGMEFDLPVDLSNLSKVELEQRFDEPFNGSGVRIIKSHIFSYNIDYLKHTWSDAPIILVYRDDDSCLGWWVRCGGFDITYPNYTKYYKNLDFMGEEIARQNAAIRPYLDLAKSVDNNYDLCDKLDILYPSVEYKQNYKEHQVNVKVY
jgi:hypothetical protein